MALTLAVLGIAAPAGFAVGPTQSDEGGKGGDDCCWDACDCCSCYLFGPDEAWALMPEDSCSSINAGGWMQLGYHSKATPLSRVYGDLGSFNDVPNNLNLQQGWMFVERVADGSDCCWDWGFRADMMYGTDAQKTQGFGGTGWDTDWDNGVYGWAMPQLYAEVERGDLNIKAGHFFTLVGYEVVTAPDNFFYSHALTMFNSEPFTHTGVLATYGLNDCVEVYGGWTAGWDTGFENFNGGSSWLGGFSAELTENVTFTYISTAGNFGARGADAYSHSVVLDVALTEDLNYVVQSDLLSIGDLSVNALPREARDDDVGVNQYLLYTLSDCWAVGGRLEWWKNEGNSNYEATFGVNYHPHANIVLRPEVRYDWNPGNNMDQATFGMDAILIF
jgi:hypothetical protein